jgi:hypothetical protein
MMSAQKYQYFIPWMLFCRGSPQPPKARLNAAPEAAAMMVEAGNFYGLLLVHIL